MPRTGSIIHPSQVLASGLSQWCSVAIVSGIGEFFRMRRLSIPLSSRESPHGEQQRVVAGMCVSNTRVTRGVRVERVAGEDGGSARGMHSVSTMLQHWNDDTGPGTSAVRQAAPVKPRSWCCIPQQTDTHAARTADVDRWSPTRPSARHRLRRSGVYGPQTLLVLADRAVREGFLVVAPWKAPTAITWAWTTNNAHGRIALAFLCRLERAGY